MKRAVVYTLALLVALCCAAPRAGAQDEGEDGNPANWCRNGPFAADAGQFRLARVRGERGARAHFYGDDDDCPAPTEKCRQKAYVVPGDELLVSRAYGEWLCSWYQPARGRETVGWIRARQLSLTEPDANPPLAAWLGSWDYYDNSLRLARGGRTGALRVAGDATWVGATPGNVHVGEVSGEAAPSGNLLRLGEDPEDCLVTLRLVGPYLVAHDNNRCGGLNVTFTGVYRKKK